MRVFVKDGAGVKGVSPVEGRERGSGGFEDVIVKDGVLLCLGDTWGDDGVIEVWGWEGREDCCWKTG